MDEWQAGTHPDGLTGVPETMLWTLHARAAEASRPDGLIDDPRAVVVRNRLGVDFAARFGPHDPMMALRARLIDTALRRWLRTHPDGTIVSLGEGLETQFWRVDNGRMRWLSIDLPEVTAIRERYLPPPDRLRHLPMSALDESWMDALDPKHGVFVVAQGLLMYFEPSIAGQLVDRLGRRFPGATLVFDTVPGEFAASTRTQRSAGAHYALPAMPWGAERYEIAPTLRRWSSTVRTVRFLPFRPRTRRPEFLEALADRVVPRRQHLQTLVQITFEHRRNREGPS